MERARVAATNSIDKNHNTEATSSQVTTEKTTRKTMAKNRTQSTTALISGHIITRPTTHTVCGERVPAGRRTPPLYSSGRLTKPTHHHLLLAWRWSAVPVRASACEKTQKSWEKLEQLEGKRRCEGESGMGERGRESAHNYVELRHETGDRVRAHPTPA